MAKDSNIGMICEQGDMGLFFDPVSEADQKKILANKDDNKDDKKDKSSK